MIVLIISSLIKKDLVLGGKLVIESDLTKKLPMISVLYPEHRVEKQGNYYAIKKEPIYFNVRSPIIFDKAEIEIEFQNNEQERIGLGVAITEEGWAFKNHTLYNKTLNDIDWYSISDGINTLYQREENFSDLNNFIKISNTIEGVSAYDFDLGESFIIHDYKPIDNEIIIDNCLRGEHKFYTYIKNEPLDFTFKIQDINRTDGTDPLIIEIYNPKNQKIYSKIISDDGMTTKIDPASDPRYISVYLPNLKKGVYRVELSCNDDIFIREIKTKQQKIVFIDRLYLCDSREYSDGFVDLKYQPTEIYTNGRLISFYTAHKYGLQTIVLDNKSININKRHKWIRTVSSPQLSKIYIPKNDLKISSRGIFALNKKHYFNPEIIDLKDYSDIEEINYIITRYQKPKQTNNEWLKNKVVFNLNDAKIENGNLKFMLSSPNLNTDKNEIKINSIKVKLTKDDKIDKKTAYKNFWQGINNTIQKYINIINKKSNEYK